MRGRVLRGFRRRNRDFAHIAVTFGTAEHKPRAEIFCGRAASGTLLALSGVNFLHYVERGSSRLHYCLITVRAKVIFCYAVVDKRSVAKRCRSFVAKVAKHIIS